MPLQRERLPSWGTKGAELGGMTLIAVFRLKTTESHCQGNDEEGH